MLARGVDTPVICRVDRDLFPAPNATVEEAVLEAHHFQRAEVLPVLCRGAPGTGPPRISHSGKVIHPSSGKPKDVSDGLLASTYLLGQRRSHVAGAQSTSSDMCAFGSARSGHGSCPVPRKPAHDAHGPRSPPGECAARWPGSTWLRAYAASDVPASLVRGSECGTMANRRTEASQRNSRRPLGLTCARPSALVLSTQEAIEELGVRIDRGERVDGAEVVQGAGFFAALTSRTGLPVRGMNRPALLVASAFDSRSDSLPREGRPMPLGCEALAC